MLQIIYKQKINLERCQKLGQKIKSTTSSNFSKFGKRLSADKYEMESLALRFSYDMEFYNRQPCEEMEQILKTICFVTL